MGWDQEAQRQRVWTFHATQTQRTRAAEGPRAGRGTGSCFLGGTGSNTVLFSPGRSGKLASSWRNWGRGIRAFLLVGTQGQWEQGGEDDTAPGLAQAGPGMGGGVQLAHSGLGPREGPAFEPAGAGGVPVLTLLLWRG